MNKKHIHIILSFSLFFQLIMFLIPVILLADEIYKFKRMWPSLHQPFYFNNPSDVDIDSNGYVYMTDKWNYCVQKFTNDGIFVSRWGKKGSGEGEFLKAFGIAVYRSDYIYVSDGKNHRIQKFSIDGEYLAGWGQLGSNKGEFNEPYGMAVDSIGFLYVADCKNHRIQKFTPDGEFVLEWGEYGAGEGQFNYPHGIAVDNNNIVYIADEHNHRVQVFEPDKQNMSYSLVTIIGSNGNSDGHFHLPYDIDIDNKGNVYVADRWNHRIQKFRFIYPLNNDTTSSFILKWGKKGNGNSEFEITHGIAIDPDGYLFVANGWDDIGDPWDFLSPQYSWFVVWQDGIKKLSEAWSSDIQKFTLEGNFIAKWSSYGHNDGFFQGASSLAEDSKGFIYVADSQNHRIQIFDINGNFISKYGNKGTNDGEFLYPYSIAIDNKDNIFVFDSTLRIQKFKINKNLSFEFILKWGKSGTNPGEFNLPTYITVDREGNNVFVADGGNHRIQKFSKTETEEYIFTTMWGEPTPQPADGKFAFPSGIGIDSNGYVYIVETQFHRIQIYKPINDSYEFYLSFGSMGHNEGQFYYPVGLKIDEDDNFYIADTWNHRIQKGKRIDGEIVTNSFGEFGSNPGQLNLPIDMCVSNNGKKVYITDANHRIQLFERSIITEGSSKAIIVAGGGPYPGNDLWPSISMNANFAYRSLIYQGISSGNIYYLSHDTKLDIDLNGENDDIDDFSKNSNLEYAIKEWAKDSDNLILYLVDHGGIKNEGVFLMNKSETLSSSDLDLWLDQYQQSISKNVIVIYDACMSGSFIPVLSPSENQHRIIITSTAFDEGAKFITQGSISFSNYFWTNIFNGLSISDSFRSAHQAMIEYQTPLLEANGNSLGNEPEDYSIVYDNYIGNSTQNNGESPIFHSVSPEQTITNTSVAQIAAYSVYDKDGISRVWAIIKPPNYYQNATLNPINEFPSIDLKPVSDNNYEVTYEKFNITGSYEITIYARDKLGNTSLPKISKLIVENSLNHKAIILTGGPRHLQEWPAIEKNIKIAFDALSFQGYSNNDIKILIPSGSSIPDVPILQEESVLSNLEDAITRWAVNNTQDLLIYLIGYGDSGQFTMYNNEILQASTLNNWINRYQNNTGKLITIILDTKYSGSFIPLLTPDSNDYNRIVITSADTLQPAYFLANGDISFSHFFWKNIHNGATLYKAFMNAKKSMEFTCVIQVSQIDDNCNGISNEMSDGVFSNNYHLGSGISLADDTPIIGNVVDSKTISENESLIYVKDVTSTGFIKQVYALIIPPCFINWKNEKANLPKIDLLWNEHENRYEVTYKNFDAFGEYTIKLYAIDEGNNVSMPVETTINCVSGNQDQYEDDDTWETANVIPINNQNQSHLEISGYEWNQSHNFHDYGDADWIKFYGSKKETYQLNIVNQSKKSNANILVHIWNTDGKSVIPADFTTIEEGNSDSKSFEIKTPVSGIYFVKIFNSNPSDFGQNADYQVRLSRTSATFNGFVTGTVTPKNAKSIIKTDGKGKAITFPNGTFFMPHIAGNFTLTASATGFSVEQKQIEIKELSVTSVDIRLMPLTNKTDMDSDGMPDEWEKEYNLNPYFDDALEDLDNDGLNNYDEFVTGNHPDNMRPDKPVLSFPENNYTNASLTTELYTENFSDPDNNEIHSETHWQISTMPFISDSSDTNGYVFNRKTQYYLTSLVIPEYVLQTNTQYYWRVNFYGDHGHSDWSDYRKLSTINEDPDIDNNTNGIPDFQEVDISLDIDNNGIPDFNQNDMKCVNTEIGQSQICLKKSDNLFIFNIENLKSIDPYKQNILISNMIDSLPFGLICFRLVVEKGEAVELTVYLSEDPSERSKWFVYDIQNSWQDLTPNNFNYNFTLTLEDGGIGDSDGLKNGVIVNLSGLAIGNVSESLPPVDVDLDDCFISILRN